MKQRTSDASDSFVPTANVMNNHGTVLQFLCDTERRIGKVEYNEPGNSDYFDDVKSESNHSHTIFGEGTRNKTYVLDQFCPKFVK
jgi:hypothetical protein